MSNFATESRSRPPQKPNSPLDSRRHPDSAVARCSELIGCPISRSLTTSCVCLELRSLPSIGVTRLQRYYEPLRHPRAPSLSLAGVWLVIPDHALGLPVLRALSLCTCCRHYPGAAAGRSLRPSRPAVSAFAETPIGSACTSTFSRIARRSLALRPAHSRCHPFVTAIRGLQTFRRLHACPGCFRLERLPGGPRTHWKAPPFTAHGASGHSASPLEQQRGAQHGHSADIRRSSEADGQAASRIDCCWGKRTYGRSAADPVRV